MTTHSYKEQLPIRLVPEEAEGVQGYLLRLATSNGVSRITELMKSGKHPSLDQLTELLGRDDSPIWRQHPGSSFWQNYNSKTNFNWDWKDRKCCPACLAEMPYWRVSWELRGITTCAKHKAKLIDTCPKCDKPLKWQASDITECTCEHDLRQIQLIVADENDVQLGQVFEASIGLGQVPEKLSFLKKLSSMDLHQLVRYLGNLETDARTLPRVDMRGLKNYNPVISRAANILAGWPETYHHCLNRIRDGASPSTSLAGLTKAFGKAYTDLYKILKSDSLSFVRTEFEKYLKEHWQWPLCKRNKRLPESLRTNGIWMPVAQAAKYLKVRRRRISDLVEQGEIQGKILTSPSGRVHQVVLIEEVDQQLQAKAEEVTLTEASQLLGLSENRVIELVEAKIIKLTKSPKETGNGQWNFSNTELQGLLQYGLNAAEVDESNQQNQVHMNGLLRSGLRGADALPSLLKEIVDGCVTVTAKVSGYNGISGWTISKTQYQKWLRRQVDCGESFYTVQQIAALLRTKEEVAYRLVNLGLLKVTSAERNGRTLRMVKGEELLRFKERYVFNSQLAEQINVAPRWLLQEFEQKGVLPYIKGSIGKAFFERTEKFDRCWSQIELALLRLGA